MTNSVVEAPARTQARARIESLLDEIDDRVAEVRDLLAEIKEGSGD